MKESWRWYGPFDRITLTEVAQTGASGIVNALHEIPYGEVWGSDAIAARRDEIANSGLGLTWNVVESLPIHEDIKRGEGDLERLFANYRQSMKNLADAGIHTICYNFMPLLDWTRTQLDAPVARGGTALRFSEPHMAAFEIHMLEREGAENDYSPEVREAAKAWFDASSEGLRQNLLNSIMSGLPGAFDRYDISGLREALKRYHGISRDEIRANYARFLAEVIPTAEELGMRFCVHPDDPPRDILGLPRIVSCEDDIAWIMEQQPAIANGLTLCAGSLGANPKNDVPAIAARFAERIHFAHLRNVAKEPDGSFQEAAHLDGDTDMVTLIAVLIAEERRRKADGRADFDIPFRPDHGHELLDDVSRGTHPGYPLVGRLRGLAELRGVIRALSHGHVHYG
ncbi:mannonate dehydratase [Agrobacterium vitis]|uniref:mannonate dehydratase n=1 Tax=Rhizobium/Agrobacterium group TaxID=227290 RepID=UPI0008DC1BAD|nr:MULTISPECIES: mannonate dehydratase [Rhizobium/Agrobacterium group]MCF1433978.1 mannonate dehydratase [Allorhizobium ampelinum]MUO91601.1 mannonate dehydratase [Agrobacterium vitis]MUZ54716.1 mannonate dehydratase [Agrobacterium vitis]MUZ94302.1 mannonate dehydratase [Agrobacterium vitis]MVA41598.1 mannonate dehydratase [Agrobacterium vitis]